MIWRLVPTTTHRDAVPEPFRPTPLQESTPTYPAVIDMLNWASLRDQLILTLGQHDLGEIIKDIVLNTVVDVPAFGVALNIYDTFFNRIQQQQGSNLKLDHDKESYTDSSSPPTGQSVLMQIAQEMQAQAKSRTQAVEPSMSTAYRLSKLYGFDNQSSWRLSHEFAEKYEWLDCNGCKLLLVVTYATCVDSKFF